MEHKSIGDYSSYVANQTFGAFDKDGNYVKYLDELEYFIPRDKNTFILDVGCRDGALVNELIEVGYTNTYGVDISPEISKLWLDSPNKGHLKVFDILTGIPFMDVKYDYIIMSHVMEHIYDIDNLFYILNLISKENTKIYIQLPYNTMYYKAHYLDFKDYYDFESTMRRFNYETQFISHTYDGGSKILTAIIWKK